MMSSFIDTKERIDNKMQNQTKCLKNIAIPTMLLLLTMENQKILIFHGTPF